MHPTVSTVSLHLSAPLLFACDDGRDYYCTYARGRGWAAARPLLQQWVGWTLAGAVGLPQPEQVLVRLRGQSYPQELGMAQGSLGIGRHCQPSLLPLQAMWVRHLADFQLLENPYDLLLSAFFDVWIGRPKSLAPELLLLPAGSGRRRLCYAPDFSGAFTRPEVPTEATWAGSLQGRQLSRFYNPSRASLLQQEFLHACRRLAAADPLPTLLEGLPWGSAAQRGAYALQLSEYLFSDHRLRQLEGQLAAFLRRRPVLSL